MQSVNPVWLWVALTAASVAVGGAMLWVAFAVVNRRQREERQGFEVKTSTTAAPLAAEPGVLREKEHHG